MNMSRSTNLLSRWVSASEGCHLRARDGSSLIDVVMLPVSVRDVVPFADKRLEEPYDESFGEAGDEVGTANDIVGIKEPERVILEAGDKLNSV